MSRPGKVNVSAKMVVVSCGGKRLETPNYDTVGFESGWEQTEDEMGGFGDDRSL